MDLDRIVTQMSRLKCIFFRLLQNIEPCLSVPQLVAAARTPVPRLGLAIAGNMDAVT